MPYEWSNMLVLIGRAMWRNRYDGDMLIRFFFDRRFRRLDDEGGDGVVRELRAKRGEAVRLEGEEMQRRRDAYLALKQRQAEAAALKEADAAPVVE